MSTLTLEGTISAKLAPQSGQSARGAWARQDFVLEYPEGTFMSSACFTAWGQDKVAELDKFHVGEKVKVYFNVRAREYSGRWYNDLRIWKITPPDSAPAADAAPRGGYTPEAPSYDAPAPTAEDMAPEGSFANDDLPF